MTPEEMREACVKVCDDWLALFASRGPQYVSAQNWANDAVKDIADAIRAIPVSRQEQKDAAP